MGSTVIILCDKAFICSLFRIDREMADLNPRTGALELTEDFGERLAIQAAVNFNATLVQWWHDHGAGGVFAELSLEAK